MTPDPQPLRRDTAITHLQSAIDHGIAKCDPSGVAALDPGIVSQLSQDLPPADFRRILATFEADLTRLAVQIEQAAMAADWETYHRASHSLAGAAAAVGALPLEQAARVAMDRRFPHPPATVVPVIREWAIATVHELATLADHA